MAIDKEVREERLSRLPNINHSTPATAVEEAISPVAAAASLTTWLKFSSSEAEASSLQAATKPASPPSKGEGRGGSRIYR